MGPNGIVSKFYSEWYAGNLIRQRLRLAVQYLTGVEDFLTVPVGFGDVKIERRGLFHHPLNPLKLRLVLLVRELRSPLHKVLHIPVVGVHRVYVGLNLGGDFPGDLRLLENLLGLLSLGGLGLLGFLGLLSLGGLGFLSLLGLLNLLGFGGLAGPLALGHGPAGVIVMHMRA